MPSPIPTPLPVVRLDFYHSIDSALLLGNHFDLAYTGTAPSTADMNTIAGLVATTWATYLPTMLSADGLLGKVAVTDLANPSTVQGQWTGSHSGSRSGHVVSLAAALVQVFHPDRRYRGSRPKTFWPFGVAGDLTGGNQWSSGFISSATGNLTSFVAALFGITSGETTLGDLVAVSYYHGSTVVVSGTTGRARNVATPRATPLVKAVESWVLDTKLGSQRRRLLAA